MNKLMELRFTESQATECWKALDMAFDLIAEKNTKSLSFQDLYNCSYNLTINRYGDFTYQQMKIAFKRIFFVLTEKLKKCPRDYLIHQMVSVWDDARYFIRIVSDIFLYFDKNYVSQKNVKTVKMISTEIFKQLMFEEDQELYQLIQSTLIDEVRRDRDGEVIEKMLLKRALNMLLEVDLIQQNQKSPNYQSYAEYVYHNSDKFYKQFFEQKLIRETAKYYGQESTDRIKHLSIEQFINLAKLRYEQEIERIKTYMHSSSEKQLKDTFLQNYIQLHAQNCVRKENSGLHYFLESNYTDIMKDMYELFRQNAQAFEIFQEGVLKYIELKGAQILSDKKFNKKDESDVVLDQLIELYEQLEQYQKQSFVNGSFAQNQQLSVGIRGAFEQVINQDMFVTIQLNKNLDLCFRRDFKSAQESEAEAKLSRNFCIFRLIKQKDVFENHYRKLLCKRLLEGTSLSEDFEKMFVNKMKQECGFGYTNKIETMFKDIESSKMEMVEFKKSVRQIAHKAQKPLLAAIDLEIQVFTLGHWPLQDPIQFNLSEELRFWKNEFEKNYKERYKQRRLTWFPTLGFVDLRAHYRDRKKEFIASTLQACILLQFNNEEKYSVMGLSERLDVHVDLVKKELGPLIQLGILLKSSAGSDEVSSSDVVVYNSGFSHRSYKLKVMVQQSIQEMFRKKEEIKEEDCVKEEVVVERKYVIESMIVRLMKTRKQLEFRQLVEQVVSLAEQRHFVPDVTLIKTCLENLMWRDYLARSEEDQNVYIYRA